MKKRKIISITVLIILLIFIIAFFNKIINFIVNVQWFNEMGYLNVYFKKLSAILSLMIPITAIIYIAIYLYFRSLRLSIIRYRNIVEVDVGRKKFERKIFIIIDLLLSIVLSYSIASGYWYMILQFLNSKSFNTKDPIFNIDVSFYVFKLPLIESLYSVFFTFLIFFVVITFIVYFVLNAKDSFVYHRQGKEEKIQNFKSGITKFAGRQLAIVCFLIMLFMSFGFLFKAFDLVYNSRGVVFGAGYTDMHVTLKFYFVIIAACILAAIAIFISIIRSKIKPIVISVVAIILLVIAQGISSSLVQNFIVKSNERTLEAPYIKDNIDYTRKAFNINNVEQKDFVVNNNLTQNDINENKDTINNIKVNSYKQSLEFYNQAQVLKYYYNFNDVDVDRYNIKGDYSQVFISPREMDLNALEGNANTWQNRHLSYTHGYGIVMSKVNSVTSEGKPDFVIKDIPPNNSTGIKITNPRIYYGELTNDYSIVNTNLGEFDYPTSSGNQINRYSGKGGIKLNIANRLLYSIYEKDINFILSRDITSQSKILINRNIVNRVKTIAPFLTYDKDPYMVINNGRLYWIIDAYTATDRYPYSQPYKGVNYMRNSVKVVVDAYDGSANFYIVDKNDPIIQSYASIFPTLFKNLDQLPSGFKEHFRYPEDLFSLQCNVLSKYHVTDISVFYNGTDIWEIAQNQKEVNGDKAANESSYLIMRLPSEKKEEMMLVNYFNMRGRTNNMSALFGARMDGDNYGKMVIFKFPPDTQTYSPYYFKQTINQDPVISQQLSLWNKDGSQVQFGDTSIIPIRDSLLYIEPIYLRATGQQSIPEMRKVVVSYSDKLIMADSIDDALNKIFNTNINSNPNNQNSSSVSSPNSNSANSDLLKQAKDYYDKALDAQKNGKWADYGTYIDKLGDVLNKIAK